MYAPMCLPVGERERAGSPHLRPATTPQAAGGAGRGAAPPRAAAAERSGRRRARREARGRPPAQRLGRARGEPEREPAAALRRTGHSSCTSAVLPNSCEFSVFKVLSPSIVSKVPERVKVFVPLGLLAL